MQTFSGHRHDGKSHYFKEGVTWTFISSSNFSARYSSPGFVFDVSGSTFFVNSPRAFTAFLCSKISETVLKMLNPTLNFQVGNIKSLPILDGSNIFSDSEYLLASEIIEIFENDWNNYETSWAFSKDKLLINKIDNSLSKSMKIYLLNTESLIKKTKFKEEENNSNFINAYRLNDELTSDVPYNEITLTCNPCYRYASNEENISERFISDTICEHISYSIGCMMGRYSLDREGLVYAHEGNKGFAELVAEGAYKTFPADNDGILPLMDDEWFDDDVTSRVKEFVRTVWGEEHLQENLDFIAESLCLYAIKPKKGESALDTIRRYLSTQFWKDHLKMYKKRPIYWLFSSGKEKAFECLVYLHRYNDATLARMRTEYVVPLLARYQANIDRLNELVDGVSGGEATV